MGSDAANQSSPIVSLGFWLRSRRHRRYVLLLTLISMLFTPSVVCIEHTHTYPTILVPLSRRCLPSMFSWGHDFARCPVQLNKCRLILSIRLQRWSVWV